MSLKGRSDGGWRGKVAYREGPKYIKKLGGRFMCVCDQDETTTVTGMKR